MTPGQISSPEKKFRYLVRLIIIITTVAAGFIDSKQARQGGSDFVTRAKEKKRPFQVYTTKKGIIAIAIALLVIITVAVVGGVVGSRKTNNIGSSSQENDPTATSFSSGQGFGSNPTPTPSPFGTEGGFTSSLAFGTEGGFTSSSFGTEGGATPSPSSFGTAEGG